MLEFEGITEATYDSLRHLAQILGEQGQQELRKTLASVALDVSWDQYCAAAGLVAAAYSQSENPNSSYYAVVALEIANLENISNSVRADTLVHCAASLAKAGYGDVAVRIYTQAVDIAEGSKHKFDCLLRLAQYERQLSKLTEAEIHYNAAFALGPELVGCDDHLVSIAVVLSELRLELGDLLLAKEWIDRAQSLLKSSSGVQEVANLRIASVMQIIDGRLGRSSVRLPRQVDLNADNHRDHIYRVYMDGVAQLEADQADLAQIVLLRALDMCSSEDLYLQGAILHGLGYAAEISGRIELARERYFESLRVRESLGNSIEIGWSHFGLGSVAEMAHELDEAETHTQTAVSLWEQGGGDSILLMQGYSNLGVIRFQKGDTDAAISHGKMSWGILSKYALREGIQSASTLLRKYPVAVSLVNFLTRSGKHGEAWRIIMEAKAILLQAELSGAESPSDERIRKLSQEEGELVRELGHVVDLTTAARNGLAARLARVRTELEEMLLRRRDARIGGDPKVAGSEEELVSLLGDGTLFLDFWLEGSVVACIWRGKVVVHVLPLKSGGGELGQNFGDLLQGVSEHFHQNYVYSTGTNNARWSAYGKLLRKLLVPDELIEVVKQADRIIVAPDGYLWRINLRVLNLSDSEEPWYLGLNKPVSEVANIGQLKIAMMHEARLRTSSHLESDSVKVIGVSKYWSSLTSNRTGTVGVRDEILLKESEDAIEVSDLREVPVEERLIRRTWSGRCSGVMGSTKLPDLFSDSFVCECLHLMGHGVRFPERPLDGGMLVRLHDRQVFRVRDVLNLRVSIKLVVMNLCFCGSSEDTGAYGGVGMPFAWFKAGVPASIGSKYPLEDLAARQFGDSIHRALKRGLAVGEAVLHASRVCGAESVGLWAGYSVYGRDSVTIALEKAEVRQTQPPPHDEFNH